MDAALAQKESEESREPLVSEVSMKTLIALFAAAMFTTAVADDQTSKYGKDKSMTSAESKFDELDRNDDEQLSKTEARDEDALSAAFASVDQDSDGYVSKSEYTARMDSEPSRTDKDPY